MLIFIKKYLEIILFIFNLLRISMVNIMIYILIHSPTNLFFFTVCVRGCHFGSDARDDWISKGSWLRQISDMLRVVPGPPDNNVSSGMRV